MTPCINLFPTTAFDAKNDNRKQNTIASYAMKKFGIEYQGFLLRFCTHRNYFNCVFRSTKLRKYAIRSLIWSYGGPAAAGEILSSKQEALYGLRGPRESI